MSKTRKSAQAEYDEQNANEADAEADKIIENAQKDRGTRDESKTDAGSEVTDCRLLAMAAARKSTG